MKKWFYYFSVLFMCFFYLLSFSRYPGLIHLLFPWSISEIKVIIVISRRHFLVLKKPGRILISLPEISSVIPPLRKIRLLIQLETDFLWFLLWGDHERV